MNARRWLIISRTVILAALVMLVLIVGLTQAQEPEPDVEDQLQEKVDMTAPASSFLSIQGRLTDAGGNPIDGTRDMTATIYTDLVGGTALCRDSRRRVEIDNGLFKFTLGGGDHCTSDDINGRKLYLGVQVEGDEEMTPRGYIYPVPYAFSLVPGAVISDSRDHVLTVRSTGSGTDDHDTLMAYAEGDGEAVTAIATDGTGIYSASENGYGIYGQSNTSIGIYGNSENGIGVYGKTNNTSNFGVVGLQTGYSTDDVPWDFWFKPAGFFGGGNGVIGITKASGGAGVVGMADHADGWAGQFSSYNGNGVTISTPASKVGLNVVGGSKNAVVRTSDGSRVLYSEESTQVWFTDYGFGKLQDGVVIIPIAPIFAQTVNLEQPYHVFVQVYGDAEVYVADRTSTQFQVHLRDGDPNVGFSYRIVAKRLGFEEHRLERAPWADDDPNLYPERWREWGVQEEQVEPANSVLP